MIFFWAPPPQPPPKEGEAGRDITNEFASYNFPTPLLLLPFEN